jgi:hypothetical protein
VPAAVPAVAPDDAADPDGADAPADDPGVAPADGATFAACLEPKMADTMLPNTLMMPSCPYCLWLTRHADARCVAAANSQMLSVAVTFWNPMGRRCNQRALFRRHGRALFGARRDVSTNSIRNVIRSCLLTITQRMGQGT